MAYEIPHLVISLTPAADLSAKLNFLVKVDSAGKAALCSAAGEFAVGVLQNKPITTDEAAVGVSGVFKCVAGAAIAAGALVTTDAAGKAKTAVKGTVDTTGGSDSATAPLVGSNVIGVALDAAAGDGSIFTLLIQRTGLVPTTAA